MAESRRFSLRGLRGRTSFSGNAEHASLAGLLAGAGRTSTLLYETTRFVDEARLRPDGTLDLLVYSQTAGRLARGGADLYGMVSVNSKISSGGGLTETVRLVEARRIYPSPDNTKFLVLRDRQGWLVDEIGDTYVLEGVGSNPDIVSWYPVHQAPDRLLHGGVYAVPLESGTARRVSDALSRDPRTTWSPDLRLLAFTGAKGLYIFDRFAGSARLLKPGSYGEPRLVWN